MKLFSKVNKEKSEWVGPRRRAMCTLDPPLHDSAGEVPGMLAED